MSVHKILCHFVEFCTAYTCFIMSESSDRLSQCEILAVIKCGIFQLEMKIKDIFGVPQKNIFQGQIHKSQRPTSESVGVNESFIIFFHNIGERNFETNMFRFGTTSSIVVRSLATWSVFGCQRNVIDIFLFSWWLIYVIPPSPLSTTMDVLSFLHVVQTN